MSIPLTVNNITFQYPTNGERGWGTQATGWANAITNGTLQKTGGLFSLTSDLDFGPTGGLKAVWFSSRTIPSSTEGVFRLANNEKIGWRNAANTANATIGLNNLDNYTISTPSTPDAVGIADNGTVTFKGPLSLLNRLTITSQAGNSIPLVLNSLDVAGVQQVFQTSGINRFSIGSTSAVLGTETLADMSINSVAGRLELATNSTRRLTILNDGKVGINNTAPAFRLDVNGNTRIISEPTGPMLRFLNSDQTGGGGIEAPNVSAGGLVITSDGGPTAFSAGGLERMRLTSTGFFGVGTNTPQTSVHAAGDSGGGTNINVLTVQNATNATFNGQSAGLVFKLSGYGGNETAKQGYIRYIATGNFSEQAAMAFGTNNGLGVFPTEKMRIDSNGNVGIGYPGAYANSRLTIIPATDNTTASTAGALTIGESSKNTSYRLNLGMLVTGGNWGASIQSITGGTPGVLSLNADGGSVYVGSSAAIPPQGVLQLIKYDPTSYTNDLVFVNRGSNVAHSQTYESGGIWASTFRDVADPAFSAGISFQRIPTNSGASSGTNILFHAAPVGDSNRGNVALRMIITSDGKLMFNETNADDFQGGNSVVKFSRTNLDPRSTVLTLYGMGDNAGGFGFMSRLATGSPAGWHQKYFGGSGEMAGGIYQNGVGTVQFINSSDATLKENIVDSPSAGTIIDAIKVRAFDWIGGSHQDFGFIAQELKPVYPDAAYEPTEFDAAQGGKWGVDHSKLIPLLLKEIQELRARVAALEA